MTNPRVFLAWQGISGDDAIHFTATPLGANDAPTFEAAAAQPVGNVGAFATSTRPVLLRVINGTEGPTVGMAWKGAGNDGSIFFAVWRDIQSDFPDSSWNGQFSLIGGTTWGPACTDFNGGLFFAWKGAGSDTGIWESIQGDSFPFTNDSQFVTGIRSALSPALVAFGNQLIMVWRGEGDIDGLFWAVSSNGTAWTHMGAIANTATTDVPSLTVFNNQVWLAFKGNDTNIYLSNIIDVGDLASDKAVWQQRWVVPGFGTSNGPSICAFGDQLFMAWKGVSDTNIWYSQSRTGAANAWSTSGVLQKTIPGVGTSYGPSVLTFTG